MAGMTNARRVVLANKRLKELSVEYMDALEDYKDATFELGTYGKFIAKPTATESQVRAMTPMLQLFSVEVVTLKKELEDLSSKMARTRSWVDKYSA